MYTVYALKSLNKNFVYVGFTNDLERRFKEHQAGRNRSTKGFKPFEILYTEVVETRAEARSRELYLKSGVGKEFLKSL